MKIILEYREIVMMLGRELRHRITPEDIQINSDPFSIEICGLNLEQVQTIRQQIPEHISKEEPEAEEPMTEVDNTKEIARMLGDNEELTRTEGGAGVPVTETPSEFLPPGASYEPPGEMSQDEIRSKRR